MKASRDAQAYADKKRAQMDRAKALKTQRRSALNASNKRRDQMVEAGARSLGSVPDYGAERGDYLGGGGGRGGLGERGGGFSGDSGGGGGGGGRGWRLRRLRSGAAWRFAGAGGLHVSGIVTM